MYLPKNLKYFRLKNGFSQPDIAKKFGYKDYTTVQKWESGKSDPPFKVVYGLSKMYGVSMNDLIEVKFYDDKL